MSEDLVSRREFIAKTGGAAVGLAASGVRSKQAPAESPAPPSERIGVGVMGLRNQGRLDGLGLLNSGEADIVTVCDVDDARCAAAKASHT